MGFYWDSKLKIVLIFCWLHLLLVCHPLHAGGAPTRFLFLGDSTMRRTVMQFAELRGCRVREHSPGCGMDEYFGLVHDDQQRWPPGACEGPAVVGRRKRGEENLY